MWTGVLFALAFVPLLLFSSAARSTDSEAGAFLQVDNLLVHAVTKRDLNLTCHIHGTGVSSSIVSWKFKGHWLDSRTLRPDNRSIQLVLRDISLHNSGVYKCGIKDPSKYDIPDQSVNVVIGDLPPKVEKDNIGCIIDRASPRSTDIKWTNFASNGQESSITFDLLYCKPSKKLHYCNRPPMGYSEKCTDVKMDVNGEQVLQCNVDSVVRQEFPHLFNVSISAPASSPNLCFIVKTRNVFGVRYSRKLCCEVGVYSSCGRPRRVRLAATKKGSITVTWDRPQDLDLKRLARLMWYNVTFAVDGNFQNKSQALMDRFSGPYSIQQTLTHLKPNTLFVVYLSCAVNRNGLANPDSIVGPFYIRTLEDVPSSSPTVTNYVVNSFNKTSRNVSISWKISQNSTWNGVIRKFLIFYRKSSETSNFTVVVVWNNVSSNSTPLTEGKLNDLDLFSEYTVKVAMCTSAGCSRPGPPYRIQKNNKEGPEDDTRTQSSDNNTLVAVGISLSGIALLSIVITAVVIFCVARHRALSQRRERLCDIGDPMPRDYEPQADTAAVNDLVYDVLDVAEVVPESPVGERSTDPLIQNMNENGEEEERPNSSLEMSTEL